MRLVDGLSSGRNQVEDRFIATTVVDLQLGERVVIPAGSEMRGIVSSVDKAGRVDRKASLTLAFDRITINGREREIRGVVTDAIEGEGVKGEVAKIGTAAGVGAIIGGILGGVKGAIAGILIGGGGIAAATPGKDVELAPGTDPARAPRSAAAVDSSVTGTKTKDARRFGLRRELCATVRLRVSVIDERATSDGSAPRSTRPARRACTRPA